MDTLSQSFLNISNYPVFPWTEEDRDYSVPPGAYKKNVCEERKSMFREVGMFTFATLCSSAASVIYFNVRMQPFESQMRVLQNGQYDSPDRMFRSVDIIKQIVFDGKDNREPIFDMLTLPIFSNFSCLKLGVLQNSAESVSNCSENDAYPVVQFGMYSKLNAVPHQDIV